MVEIMRVIKLSVTELDMIKEGTAKVVVELDCKPQLELQAYTPDTVEVYATSDDEIGYFEEGQPTDAQLRLQDDLDSATQEYIDGLLEIYSRYGQDDRTEFPHDIRVLTEIRERAQDVLQLKDIY